MRTYNKLVRDNIPEIIRNGGSKCDIVVLDEAGYKRALTLKLKEESQEVVESKSLEALTAEIADVYEVLQAIQKAYGIQSSDIAKIQAEKAIKNGRFEKRLFLKAVYEDCGHD